MENPIDFDLIEEHKENIEPLREGRSAVALKQVLTTPQGLLRQQQLEERSKIEEQLLNVEELDDPIQPYLDYIAWTLKNFPSGRSVESGLLQLFERCTSHFRDVQYYKNDPRYLQVWLSYAKYSENPRDIFVYLSRKDIGKQLASFYEEYANYLEAIDKNTQACQVYEEGIKQSARPLKRLERRYEEYKSRHSAEVFTRTGQESPVFHTRTALTVKSGGSLFTTHDGTKSTEKTKLDIFNDPDGDPPSISTGGWDNLKSAVFRSKENRLEATSWVGETLPQESTTSKTKPTKVTVFKDSSELPSASVFKVIEVPGKRSEKVDLNFDLLYQDDEEFCSQEILAMMRGVYFVNKENKTTDSPPLVTSLVSEKQVLKSDLTIKLGPESLKERVSPTVTLFTKEAKDEIYSMFNQDAVERRDDNEEERGEEELVYDDFTEQFTRTVNDLTENTELKRRRLDHGDIDSLIQKTCVVAPADEKLKDLLLDDLSPSLNTYKGLYHYEKSMNMCNTLKKSLNIKQSKHVFIEFEGTHDPYNLKTLLGEGGFACVYLAESMTGDLKAIKCQRPSSAWEFYILTQVHNRLQGDLVLTSVVLPDELHFYEDESYLILDYIEKGTILDVVNIYRSTGRPVDEVLVVFFTSELLKVIESLHSVGILHGDLKPDNCMLRISGKYTDSSSWKDRGIKLIDFGRSIDMNLFPKNVEFKCNWKTDSQDCPEMRNKETWTYQADYFGIAGIIHSMLYGSFIETKFDGKKYVLSSPIKRYWQQDLWNPLFDFLMNSKSYGPLPQTELLREHRLKLEKWLEGNDGSLLTILKEIRSGLK